MKKCTLFLLIIFILMSLFLFFTPRFLNCFVKSTILRLLPESKVSLEKFVIRPGSFNLVNLKIKRDEYYEFIIKELVFRFNITSLFRKEIEGEVNNGFIYLNFDKFKLPIDNKNDQAKLKVKTMNLKNIEVKLKGDFFESDLYLHYAEIIPEDRLVKKMFLKINFLNIIGLKFKDALLEISDSQKGNLEIRRLSYGKLNLEDTIGDVFFQKYKLLIYPFKIKFCDGHIGGELTLDLEKGFNYHGKFRFSNIIIKKLVEDLEYKNKFNLTGKLTGDLFLVGNGFDFRVIKGEFSFSEPGILSIEDINFAKKFAEKTGQPFGIIWENLRNYQFNKGIVRLDLENSDLIIKVFLEGEKGRRHLEVNWHDFKIGR